MNLSLSPSLLCLLLLVCVFVGGVVCTATPIPIPVAGHDPMGTIADAAGRNIIIVPGEEPNIQDTFNATWNAYESNHVSGANTSYFHWFSNEQGEHFTAIHYSPLKQIWDVQFSSYNLSLWSCTPVVSDFIVLPDTRRGYDELLIFTCRITTFGNPPQMGVAAIQGSTGNLLWNLTYQCNSYISPVISSDSSTVLLFQDTTGEVLYVNAASGVVETSTQLPIPCATQKQQPSKNTPTPLFNVRSNVVKRFRENQFYMVINGCLTSYIFMVDFNTEFSNFDILLKISWSVPMPPSSTSYQLAAGALSVYAMTNVSVTQYAFDGGQVGYVFNVIRDGPACVIGNCQPNMLQGEIIVFNTGNETMGEQFAVGYESAFYNNVAFIIKQDGADPTRGQVVGQLWGKQYYAGFGGSDFNGNVFWNLGGEFTEVHSPLTGSLMNVGISFPYFSPLIQFTQSTTQPPTTYYLTQNGMQFVWQTVSYNYSTLQEARTDGKSCAKTGMSNFTQWCQNDQTEPASDAPFSLCPQPLYPPRPYAVCSDSPCYNFTNCATCSTAQNFQCLWCSGVCVNTGDYDTYSIGICSQAEAYHLGHPTCPSEHHNQGDHEATSDS